MNYILKKLEPKARIISAIGIIFLFIGAGLTNQTSSEVTGKIIIVTSILTILTGAIASRKIPLIYLISILTGTVLLLLVPYFI